MSARDVVLAYNPAEEIDLGEVAASAARLVMGEIWAVEMTRTWMRGEDLGFTCRIEVAPKDKRRRRFTIAGLGESRRGAADHALAMLALEQDASR